MPKYNSPRIMSALFVQLRDAERQIIQGAIAATGGRPGRAAVILGVTRRYLRMRAGAIGGFLDHPIYEPPNANPSNKLTEVDEDAEVDVDTDDAASEAPAGEEDQP